MYGGPYVVDFTAPELVEGGGVWDGEGEDMDYQNSTTIVADWSAITDPESGVVECGWSIGEEGGREGGRHGGRKGEGVARCQK